MLTAQKIVVEELFNGLAPDWRHWLIDSFDHMHVHDEDDHWHHVPGTLMYWPLAIEASIYIVNRTPQHGFFYHPFTSCYITVLQSTSPNSSNNSLVTLTNKRNSQFIMESIS